MNEARTSVLGVSKMNEDCGLDAISRCESLYVGSDQADIYCEVSLTDDDIDSAIEIWEPVP